MLGTRIPWLSLAAVALLFPHGAWSGTFTDEATGLQAWVPDNWVRTDADGAVTAAEPTGEARVILSVVSASDLATAAADIDRMVRERIDNPVVTGTPEPIESNGVPGVLLAGTGALEGQPVHWAVGVFHRNGHALFIIAIALQATYFEHQDNLSLVMVSVAPR